LRALAGMIPGARFELIESCGHIPCIEQPAALADILDDFINA
jgi:3-oxoadipate enol-lactonase